MVRCHHMFVFAPGMLSGLPCFCWTVHLRELQCESLTTGTTGAGQVTDDVGDVNKKPAAQ